MAVCTSATSIGEPLRDTINQAAPTFCIQIARFIAKAPSQSQRKAGKRKGAHREFELSVIRFPVSANAAPA
ncbi:hypothetical protein D9M68_503780 [compost metagenome]